MFDMSWGEIMVIGGVALIVIGPKDLPKALRTVGQMTSKMRRLAGEFQSQFNEAMREAELDEVKKQVSGLNDSLSSAASTAFNPIQTIRDELRTAVDQPSGSTPPSPALPSADHDIWGTNPGPVDGHHATTATSETAPADAKPADASTSDTAIPATGSGQPVEEIGPIPHVAPVGAPQPVDPTAFVPSAPAPVGPTAPLPEASPPAARAVGAASPETQPGLEAAPSAAPREQVASLPEGGAAKPASPQGERAQEIRS